MSDDEGMMTLDPILRTIDICERAVIAELRAFKLKNRRAEFDEADIRGALDVVRSAAHKEFA